VRLLPTFLFLTSKQIHVGIKVVLFQFPAKLFTLNTITMSSLVLWISAELWLSQELASALTREAGI
jgi:hypothetical protein